MLIVLLLSAIVAGLGFMVLLIVNLQFSRIEEHRQEKTQIILLKRELSILMYASDSILWDNEYATLSAYKSGDLTQALSFTESGVVKESDTLSLMVKNVNAFSEGKKTENENIDALWIEVGVSNRTIPIFISKRRPATTRSDFIWD